MFVVPIKPVEYNNVALDSEPEKEILLMAVKCITTISECYDDALVAL